MSLLVLTALVMAALSAGYVLYGRTIARRYNLDDAAATPAVRRADGIDFVPTRPFYLLGQHFSAIAAAGPIVGPIAACMSFGWGPCVLWIVLGVVFIGAVHDFSALVASVRHDAGSIAEIARRNLGRRAWLALVLFIWIALVYVLVAFTEVTAATFVGVADELRGLEGAPFNAGGAVAAASVMYLALALVMGLVMRFLRPPVWLATLVFVPCTLGAVWFATTPAVSTLLVQPVGFWKGVILAYCFVASLLPVWILQQSRGYLGGFVLYLTIAVGVAGLLFGGFAIERPAFAAEAGALGRWIEGGPGAPALTQLLFPFLFVTIACGACSGFHGLVCCGTTSRQIAKETHCKPVAFGAMLLEGFVALIALATVMIVPVAAVEGRPPGAIFGDGLARFLVALLGPASAVFAATFGKMAVATFIFDTLDVATRLGRYLLQEVFGVRGPVSSVVASLATVGAPGLVLLAAPEGSWLSFWTLFGAANQLLAALTLLGITVWLRRSGKSCWWTFLPMLFVLTVTLCALVLQVIAGARSWLGATPGVGPAELNGVVALALLALAAVFIREAVRAVRPGAPRSASAESTGVEACTGG